eukprot:sb/3465602/
MVHFDFVDIYYTVKYILKFHDLQTTNSTVPQYGTASLLVSMSAGAKPSASREFEGLDIEHDPKQVSFPGYKVTSYTNISYLWHHVALLSVIITNYLVVSKHCCPTKKCISRTLTQHPMQVKGGYVSPYSCQALGLKKRSGSSASLCSQGSIEADSPVRRSPSKGAMRSSSRSSVLSKSSSRGSMTGVPSRGTFGSTPRGLTATSTPRRSASKSKIDTPSTPDRSTPRARASTASPASGSRPTTGIKRTSTGLSGAAGRTTPSRTNSGLGTAPARSNSGTTLPRTDTGLGRTIARTDSGLGGTRTTTPARPNSSLSRTNTGTTRSSTLNSTPSRASMGSTTGSTRPRTEAMSGKTETKPRVPLFRRNTGSSSNIPRPSSKTPPQQ